MKQRNIKGFPFLSGFEAIFFPNTAEALYLVFNSVKAFLVQVDGQMTVNEGSIMSGAINSVMLIANKATGKWRRKHRYIKDRETSFHKALVWPT